jgi:hypothetical protein
MIYASHLLLLDYAVKSVTLRIAVRTDRLEKKKRAEFLQENLP